MVKYDPELEPSGDRDKTQPNGVSEDPRNEGWHHRSSMARNQFARERQEGVTSNVLRKRHGEEYFSIEGAKTQHEQDQDERPKSDNHGESCDSDYPHGRPLTDKERIAKKHGEYWSDSKKRDFLANDTDLSADDFGWE